MGKELIEKAFNLFLKAIKPDEYEEVIILCDQALKLDPENTEAYYFKGRALLNLHNNKQALTQFESILNLAPNHIEAFHFKCETLISQGDYGAVIKSCSEVLKQEFKGNESIHARAFTIKARIALILGNYQEALEFCYLAIKLDPEEPLANYIRAQLYLTRGYYKEALQISEEAIKQPFYTPLAYVLKALILARLNKCQQALDLISENITTFYPIAIIAKAEIYLWENHPETTIKLCDEVLSVQPKNLQALSFKAKALIVKDQYKEADSCWQKIYTINPQWVDGWIVKSLITWESQNSKEAIKDSQKALKINPNHTGALSLIAELLISDNDCKTAIEYCDKALQINNQHSEAWAIKAEAYMLLSNYKLATQCYKKALEINSSDSKALLVEKTVAALQEGMYLSPFAAAYHAGFFKKVTPEQVQRFLQDSSQKKSCQIL